jgi:adenylate cyclase
VVITVGYGVLRQFWLISYLFEQAFTFAFAMMVSINAGLVRRDRDLIKRRFGMIVDLKLVDEMTSGMELRSRRIDDVIVFFSDMRDFTRLSQDHDPNAVIKALNEYCGMVTRVVREHGGIIDKFVGDAVMALWGVTERGGAEADAALRASMEIRRRLALINARRVAEREFPIRIGMGLHCGSVIVGPIGTDERIDYTAIGAAVNVAARIQGMSKTLASDLIISEGVHARLKARVPLRDCGPHLLRGIEVPVRLYHVMNDAELDGAISLTA